MTYPRLMEEIPNNHLGWKKNFVNNGKQTTTLNLVNTRFLNDQKYQNKKNGLKTATFWYFFRNPKKLTFFWASSSKDASRSREVGRRAEDCGILWGEFIFQGTNIYIPIARALFYSMMFLFPRWDMDSFPGVFFERKVSKWKHAHFLCP